MYKTFFQHLSWLWGLTKGGKEVCVAVIDGAIDTNHPAFRGASIKQTNIYGEEDPPDEPSGHGTHVASIIFGQHQSEIQGIAPKVRGLVVPIFGKASGHKSGFATQMDLARAINVALEAGANIINISAGELDNSGEPDALLSNVLEQCSKNNVLVVAAAGNDACHCLHVPAATPTVLSIGAMDEAGEPLDTSNWGDAYLKNGLLAPGKRIPGAEPNNRYCVKTGTSFATPLVSGIAALMLSLQMDWEGQCNPMQVKEILLNTASPCPEHGKHACYRFLRGIINVKAAIRALFDQHQQPLPVSFTISQNQATNEEDWIKTYSSSFNNLKNSFAMENVQDNLSVIEQNVHEPVAKSHLQLSELPNVEPTVSGVATFPSEVADEAFTPGTVTYSGVSPSCGEDCGCGGGKKGGAAPTKAQKVYALGTINYDFVNESRRDSFTEQIGIHFSDPNINIHAPNVLISFLESGNQASVSELIWTLEQEGTPIYAIHPFGAYARETYTLLLDFLKEQTKDAIERVAIPGTIVGKTTLMSGQVVPVIVPVMRGMASWSTTALVEAVTSSDEATDNTHAAENVYNFLERVYFEFRNFGTTPQERALNYTATNAFNVSQIFIQAINLGLQLATMTVTKSPITRPGVEGYDVKIVFFDPQHRHEKSKLIFSFTIDVTDVIPVNIGRIHSWYGY